MEWKVTDLQYVSVPFLQRMLREEVGEGWTELSCHRGMSRRAATGSMHGARS